MGFFELPPPEPQRRRRRRRRKLEDPWTPPSIYLPRYLQRNFVLASNDEVAVVIQGIACYPNGFEFELRTVTRFEPDEEDESAHYYGLFGSGHPSRGAEVPPEQLRFGLSFSDGSKCTTLDPWNDLHDGEKGMQLHQGSGGGGNGQQHANLWVTPIPPEGPVEFVCEWPAFGIEETRRRIDGSHFIKAAGKSKPIF